MLHFIYNLIVLFRIYSDLFEYLTSYGMRIAHLDPWDGEL
jgi:hypothetical protein